MCRCDICCTSVTVLLEYEGRSAAELLQGFRPGGWIRTSDLPSRAIDGVRTRDPWLDKPVL